MQKWSLPPIASKVHQYTSGEWNEQFALFPHRVDPFQETSYTQLWGEYGSSISTYRMEFLFSVVTGRVDVDKEWDNYLAQMNQLGLDKLNQELNKMPLFKDLMEQ